VGVRSWFEGWPVYRQLTGDDPLGRGAAVESDGSRALQARTETADRVVKSICPYCAVGCGRQVYVRDEQVIQIEGDPDGPAGGALMKHSTNTAQRAALRRLLAAVVIAAGLASAGCANNSSNAPGAPSPSNPVVTAATWARSMCLALHPAFSQLGTPPQSDVDNPAATRQALVAYLNNAGNATQQTIDRFSSIGAPPVANGQQILDRIRNQLIQMRTNLTDAAAQLGAADPNDSAAIGQAFGAAGNVIRLIGVLATDPELRAAIDQTPECQSLAATSGRW
jgi:hypothetical protein